MHILYAHCRFAIELAAKMGQVESVKLLLEGGLDPFLASSGDQQVISSLSSALEPLVISGDIEAAVNLLLGLSLGQYLWCSQHASSFLFSAQTRYDGSEEFESILKDLVSFLATNFLNWETETAQMRSCVLNNMKRIRYRCFLNPVKACSSIKNLVLLLDYAVQSPNGAKLGELFNYLCAHGNDCLVRFIVQASCPDTAAKIVSKPDSQGLTPLAHAACGGHLNTVKWLLDHGAELTHGPGISPLVGVILYLALAPYNIGGDVMGKTYRSSCVERGKVLKHFRSLLPQLRFSPLCEDPSGAAELVELLLLPSPQQVLPNLFNSLALFSSLYTLLLLTAAVRDSSALQPLLERISSELFSLPPSSAGEISTQSDSGVTPAVAVYNAACFAPVRAANDSSRLFESFFVQHVKAGPQMTISILTAARKGYWDIVEAAVSTNKLDFDTNIIRIWLLAISAGKRDTLRVLLKMEQKYELPTKKWWYKLAQAAVRANHPEMLSDLISAGCSTSAYLRAAARLGSQEALHIALNSASPKKVSEIFFEVVTLAAKCNQLSIVESLFSYYTSHTAIEIDSQCSRNDSFWLYVLVGGTSHGHQALCLQAVSHISDENLRSTVSQHEFYSSVVYYSCYWGLSDLLSCLPCTERDLLERQGGRESPLEASMANGRLGCMPSFLNRFFLTNKITSWFEGGHLQLDDEFDTPPFSLLVTGLFHQVLSGEPSIDSQLYRPTQEQSKHFLFQPRAFEIFKKFSGNFCGPLVMCAQLERSLDFLYDAVVEGNNTLLEQVLRVLFDSRLLPECFECSEMDNIHSVVLNSQCSSLELLLRCGGVFVSDKLTQVNKEGQNVLHTAVLSQGHDTDKLELILDRLGKSAPDMCLAMDKHGCSPISLAFMLSKHKRAARLIKEAVKSPSFSEKHPAVEKFVEEACKARGWLRVLLEGRKKPDRQNIHVSEFDIRSGDYVHATKVLGGAALQGNGGVAQAILEASCEWILEDTQCDTYLNRTVLNAVSNCPSYIHLPKVSYPAEDYGKKFFQLDTSEELVELIELVESGKIPGHLDMEALFSHACVQARASLVKHLLSRDPRLPPGVVEKGMFDALAFGALEIAAEIITSSNSHSVKSAKFDLQVSPVVERIFIAPRDYQTMVEDMFESLAHSRNSSRLSLSEQWLAHEWRPFQRELADRANRNQSRISPNTWMISVNWKGSPHPITVKIEWDFFTQTLLQSPLTEKEKNTPMFVEAVVFSSAVLGQLVCPTEGGTHSIHNLANFFDSPQPPESLEVSSVVWPLPPTAELTSSHHRALLCLSYNPQQRVFVWPSAQQTTEGRLGDESYSTDSGMHSLCFTDTSIDTKDDDDCNTSIFVNGLADFCRFHQKRLKRRHKISASIAVEAPGVSPFNLQSTIDLCSDSLKLSSLSTVVYAGVPRPRESSWMPPTAPPKSLFGHIGINIDTAREGEPSTAIVSLVDSGLDFSITLATDTPELPSYEVLLQQTVDCALEREVQVLRERLERFVRTLFVPRLQKVLRTKLDRDSVCVLLESASGTTTLLSHFTAQNLLLLKSLNSIKVFLMSFCDMLRAYSHKPRVFAGIRSQILQGLSVIISDISSTKTAISSSGLQLVVHTRDTSQPHRQGALLSLSNSLLRLPQPDSSTENLTRDFKALLGAVPCPFLSHVDLENSISFLYPVVGDTAKLLVQVVGYGGENLLLPLKYNCWLQVFIVTPSGNRISASSSEEPSLQGASADLLVATSDSGVYEVVWKPREVGLHSIWLTLNGVAIQQQFKRVYVDSARSSPGKSVVAAGDSVVFVAAHVEGVCPFTNRHAQVVLMRDTVIKPSPLLSDISGYKTFTVPSPATTTSFFPSKQLDEVVSSMTGSQPLSSPPLLHHLSITASHSKSKRWSHTPTSHVTLHIGSLKESKKRSVTLEKRQKKPNKSRRVKRCRRWSENYTTNQLWVNPKCVSLGCGLYKVSLEPTKAGTYHIFASCPLCQSVMRVHWLEGQSFYPQPLYVVPGTFSPTASTLTDSSTGT